MPPKQESNVEHTVEVTGIEDNYWLEKLLGVEKEQLIQIISLLINRSNIDNRSIKRARTELPSFSMAKWSDFAMQAGLPEDPRYLQLEYFETPVYQLPPSFHNAVFQNSWRTQDAYQEAVEHTIEASRVRILDPGRIIDIPEEAMLATTFATGNEVDHKIIMIGGILVFVLEVKLNKPSNNDMAQLFLEFISAASANKETSFKGLRVYGVLTNLSRFEFFSYDPISNSFCQDDSIFISPLRDGFLSGMIHVTNKFFGLVLSAFIDGLRTRVQKSTQMALEGNSSRADSLPLPPDFKSDGKGACSSTVGWNLALSIAEECCQKFMEDVTTIEDMEIRSTEALDLLTKSVCLIPRFSAYTTTQNKSYLTTTELKELAQQTVKTTLQDSLL